MYCAPRWWQSRQSLPQVAHSGMGIAANGERGRAVAGKLLGNLNRCPAVDDAANERMPRGVEVGDLARRVAVSQKIRFLAALAFLGIVLCFVDPSRSSRCQVRTDHAGSVAGQRGE